MPCKVIKFGPTILPTELHKLSSDTVLFKGIRKEDGCEVEYLNFKGEYQTLPLFLDHVNHSPCGFEWGYDGSGPSQLAYAILYIWSLMTSSRGLEKASDYASRNYIHFRQISLSLTKGDSFEFTLAQMDEFIKKVGEMEEFPFVAYNHGFPRTHVFGPMNLKKAVAFCSYQRKHGVESRIEYAHSIDDIRNRMGYDNVLYGKTVE